MKPYCSAIIPAAGNSTRMAMGQSKQFLPLLGKPAIVYTLQAFEQAKSIDEIILVCRDEDKERLHTCVYMAGITKPVVFTLGGTSRQQSVFSGVRACASQTEYIIIHDGARPLITWDLIEKVTADAFTYGAAALGVPVKDTIKVTNAQGFATATPDRSTLWAVQTPQVFEKTSYLSAVKQAVQQGADYTDDCQLMEQLGKQVHLCMGSYENIKLTTKEDLIVAQAILNQRSTERSNS